MAAATTAANSASMPVTRIAAQLESLSSVAREFPAAEVICTTPKLLARMERAASSAAQRVSQPNKPLCFTFREGQGTASVDVALALQVEFPSGFPDLHDDPLRITICDSVAVAGREKLQGELDSFVSACAGYDCLVDAVRFVQENAAAASDTSAAPLADRSQRVAVLSFNHLLKGGEHKKEKEMVSAAKSHGLSGFIVYGTPGLVILVGFEEGDDSSYLVTSRGIGKRGDVVYEGKLELGEAATSQASRKGLGEIDLSGVRELLGGDEELYREVIGVR